jgi:hypothetical protein
MIQNALLEESLQNLAVILHQFVRVSDHKQSVTAKQTLHAQIVEQIPQIRRILRSTGHDLCVLSNSLQQVLNRL